MCFTREMNWRNYLGKIIFYLWDRDVERKKLGFIYIRREDVHRACLDITGSTN